METTTAKKAIPTKDTEEIKKKTTPVDSSTSKSKPAKKAPEKSVKRPKTRNIEELIQAATRGMTDKEKTLLIKHLREEIIKKNTQIDMLQKNSETAFEQARHTEQHYDAMERYYRDRLAFVKDQTEAFTNAVLMATTGGTN